MKTYLKFSSILVVGATPETTPAREERKTPLIRMGLPRNRPGGGSCGGVRGVVPGVSRGVPGGGPGGGFH